MNFYVLYLNLYLDYSSFPNSLTKGSNVTLVLTAGSINEVYKVVKVPPDIP